ncbi:hypothetical protein Tco_1378880 [Tanacetum coccineum]
MSVCCCLSSVCCLLSAAVCLHLSDFEVFLSNSQCSIVSLRGDDCVWTAEWLVKRAKEEVSKTINTYWTISSSAYIFLVGAQSLVKDTDHSLQTPNSIFVAACGGVLVVGGITGLCILESFNNVTRHPMRKIRCRAALGFFKASVTRPADSAALASTLRNAIMRDLGDTYTGLSVADREFLTRGLDHLAAGFVAPPSVAAAAHQLTSLLLVHNSAYDNVPNRVDFFVDGFG